MNENNNVVCHLPSDRYNDYNLGEFGLPTMLTTSDKGIKLISLAKSFDKPSWARFMLLLRHTVQKDRRLFFIDGVPRMASINWLRDHVHEMKAYKHWEYDLKSYLDFMIENQSEEGFFYEITVVNDNCHTKVVGPHCVKPLGDNLSLVRIEIEADVEYLVVEGAVSVYKATGDETWMKKILPKLEKAIDYMTSSPKRWDSEKGLVKRAFTIDTWDFVYGKTGMDRNIYPDTPMSIMHGDNSGVYQAMIQLAWLNRRFENEQKALLWEQRAAQLRDNLNKYCWNGKFYTHQVHLNHSGAEDADETKILSLSNTYDMNRGVTTPEQTESIIEEYRTRLKSGNSFAEWYCIDPYYKKFKDGTGEYRTKSYVNGGISTFTAGELAKAAFNNGFEEYGWNILTRLRELVSDTGEIYFLYDPDTAKNISGGPSGWGAAAIMDSIDAGLAGIKDGDILFNVLDFSPKWAATDLEEVRYITGYEISKSVVETRYWKQDDGIVYELLCPSHTVNCHILLPAGKTCKAVLLDGKETSFNVSKVRESSYADFTFKKEAPADRDNWSPLKTHTIKLVTE